MTDGALFGLELMRARERRGLSLDQLAEVTKVSGSLYAALERGDVARWPGGIFRRAFVRAYAQAVGLEPEDTLARFLRVFPEAEGGEAAAQAAAAAPVPADAAPRLVLDEAAADSDSTRGSRAMRRVGAPLLDLLLAGIPAAAASLVYGWQWFFPVAALIGLVGHVVALTVFGATPGTWLLPRPAARRLQAEEAQARRRAETEPAATTPRRRQLRHTASSSSRPIPARTRRVQH